MQKRKIDKEFIKELRTNPFGVTNWIFDNSDYEEIVPNELTHEYLFSNFQIDKRINRYYHIPTSNLLSQNEFAKMQSGGFIGEKETALNPYSIVISGAYYLRSDLAFKFSIIPDGRIPITINGNKIEYLTDLVPYFKEYAKGFKSGFDEFDKKQITPFLTAFPDKQDYLHKVFEFITKDLFVRHSWSDLLTGFTMNQNNDIINAFEHGEKQGYFYRAWSIVLSNNNLFAPFFTEIDLRLIRLKTNEKNIKFKTKYHVLAYILESHATGNSMPIGNKKQLETIGNSKLGKGKGNTFYKEFNKIIAEDLNSEKSLIEIGGENWKEIILSLSTEQAQIKQYLQSKQL